MSNKYIFIVMTLLLVLAGCGGGISAYRAGDYDSLIKSGWDEYNQNDFDEANQIFCDAKSLDTERPEAYIGCGWALFMRQHPDSALVEFFHGFEYTTTMSDTVDAACGISGSYLALNQSNKVISFLAQYDMAQFEDVFPLKEHDFFLERGDLELLLAQAFYRLGIYSSTEGADPDNAVYHLNQALAVPYTYTDPESLMGKMTEYLSQSKGGLYR